MHHLYKIYIGGTNMYEIIANLLKESKKTTVITGDGISIDSQKIDYKTSVDNQVYNCINLSNVILFEW